jgi:hypothetical protein
LNILDSFIRDGLPLSLLDRPVGPPGGIPHLHEISIAIRSDGVPDVDGVPVTVIGDGTKQNPFDGSTARKLDYIMLNLAAPETHIRFNSGLFRTGGGLGIGSGAKWTPRSGQRISGAGMHQTTVLLTLYPASVSDRGIDSGTIIHSNQTYLEGFELSDLTLDCGQEDQPMPVLAKYGWPQIMCRALVLAGRNISIRRVRFVNYGTRAPITINGIAHDTGMESAAFKNGPVKTARWARACGREDSA